MKLQDLSIDELDFTKANGLVVAIAQHARTREILMVAFQDRQAIEKTVETREMWYYSRSRRQLWHKGETSGNVQKVMDVLVDCDRDSLLYKVEPAGPACHTGARTCFGDEDFDLARLEDIILKRQANPKSSSYTNKLLADPALVLAKIKEEAGEVIQAVEKKEGKKQLVWEAADLFYHVLVCLVQNGCSLAEIENEFKRRNNN